jgi:tetratricopeptide (TPR) repeat protein
MRNTQSARTLLARCVFEQGRAEEAQRLLENTLIVDVQSGYDRSEEPQAAPAAEQAEWWYLYAQVLSAQKLSDRAANAARHAFRLDPSRMDVASSVLIQSGKHEDNITLLRSHISPCQQHATLWTALGTSLNALGRTTEAVDALETALSLTPGDPAASWALGVALLRLGQYKRGFQLNEFRQNDAGECRRFGVAPWRGQCLTGKHLVVRYEQGFGDTAQFVRFLPLVRNQALRTTLVTPRSLVRLFRANPSFGEVSDEQPRFGFGDYQTLLMSLPHLLGIADAVDSVGVPYLFPEPERVQSWQTQLPVGPRVGLVWQGNPNFAGDPWRSMPFSYYEPLIERFTRSVSFLSLQKHVGRDQLETSPQGARVLDLGDQIDRDGHAFVDSLAILTLLDLFITTDTGLAHLAGAAGVRTWLLLGTAPDWRWGVEGEVTQWYPSVRLFRQRRSGDWVGVLDEVMRAFERVTCSTSGEPTAAEPGASHSGSKSCATCSIPPHVVGTGA